MSEKAVAKKGYCVLSTFLQYIFLMAGNIHTITTFHTLCLYASYHISTPAVSSVSTHPVGTLLITPVKFKTAALS